jgi:adenylate cyclase
VIANTRHMMGLLAENASKEPLEQRVALMDEAEFRETLQELTRQSQRFLEATALARDRAHRSLLEQTLRVFTRRVAELLDAERASLFLVDQDRGEMTLCVSQDLAAGETVRIPIGSGIAGAAAASGRPVRVADAYEDPRFNRNVDVKTGFRTRSVPCLPLHDSSGNVFAVTQLLNRRDGRPFDEDDEARYADFAGPLGVLLESLVAMGGVETA